MTLPLMRGRVGSSGGTSYGRASSDAVHDHHERPLVLRQRREHRPLAVTPRQLGGACVEQHPVAAVTGFEHIIAAESVTSMSLSPISPEPVGATSTTSFTSPGAAT